MDNVLAVTFSEDSKAYEALSVLKRLDGEGQIQLTAATVVVRNEDGHLESKDEVGDTSLTGTSTGGLIGLIVGILGGPFGVLLGGATGLLIGSLFDLDDADLTESALSEISRSVQVGHTALLAQVSEPSPEVIDTAMSGLGGTVVRRSLEDVEAEIAAAEDAQRAAKKAAREQLHEQRRTQAKEKIQAKVEELKGKLPGREKAGASSSS
jgi:uncharacterized membrane protein